MSDRKIIAVIGATGAQGGGLVRAILADPSGRLRAAGHHPEHPTPTRPRRSRARRGGRRRRPRRLRRASARRSPGPTAPTASRTSGSTSRPRRSWPRRPRLARGGPDGRASRTSSGRRSRTRAGSSRSTTTGCRPCRAGTRSRTSTPRARRTRFFADVGVPTTFLLTSFYWDNLIHFGMGPKRGPDGKLAFVLPMADRQAPRHRRGGHRPVRLRRLPARARRWRDRRSASPASTSPGRRWRPPSAGPSGRRSSTTYVPPEVYRTFGFPGADDLGNMFQFNRDFSDEFCGLRDLELSRSLNPSLQTFDAWLSANAGRIPRG